MPEETEESRTDLDQEEEGGPVKSFLEHLEDLRWVLIKTLAALGVSFVVCLVAGDYVVKILTHPLKQARIHYPNDVQVVTFLFGTNRLGPFQVPWGEEASLGPGAGNPDSWDFAAEDISNLRSFVRKLKQPKDAVSVFIHGQLSTATRLAITNYSGWLAPAGSLRTALVRDLNQILAGQSIYDAQRFAKVELRSETRQLLEQDPHGGDLIHLNRLLLEDAYPNEILRSHKFVTFHLEPVTVGTNLVLGLRADAGPAIATSAEHLMISLESFSPAGAFLVAVQVAAYAGVILASPFILYFVAAFVFPALKMHERKYIYRGMFYGLGLFFIGVAFCYFALMPIALGASVKYTEWLGFAVYRWRAEDYISFVSKFMLGMGLGFEMPVILLVLVKIGVLNHTILARARRYVIVICFFMGAVLTTPEIITQVLMALPLLLLYEITVWIAWYWERQERKRARAAERD